MSKLLIHESPLQVLPTLAQKIGLNEAIILQQIHYWLNPDHNKNHVQDRYWVYNSYEQWQQQFPFWSKETIKRTIYSLEKQHLILSQKLSEKKFDHRKWYSIDYETLQGLEQVTDRSSQNDTIGEIKMTRSVRSKCDDHYKEQRLQTETNAETSPTRARMAQQMVDLWNQTFDTHPPVQLTSFRKTKLPMILFTHFNNDLKEWQKFCNSIQSSAFLQGKGPRGWRATLDWCVEEANLFKILEGNYQDNVSDQPNASSSKDSLRTAQSHIQALSDPQHQQLALGICAQLSPNTYNSWFHEMRLEHRTGSRIVLSFPTQFICDYVMGHYLGTLRQLVQPLYPGPQQLELVVQKAMMSQPPQLPSLVEPRSRTMNQKPVLSMVKELAQKLSQQESWPQRMSQNTCELSSISKAERTSS